MTTPCPPRVAVTGASGFIGRHLLSTFAERGVETVPLVRRPCGLPRERVVDLSRTDTLAAALDGCGALVHGAGFAHVHSARSADDEKVHDRVNRQYAVSAAEAALRAGVKRFVLLSSVKAVGEPGKNCVDEGFAALPATPYGRAKRAAEEALRTLLAPPAELVVLRLSMVYGPGSRGNLERMLRLVARRRFPPLPDTANRRSMVHVADACEAIVLAVFDARAPGRTYYVAHPQPVSGRQLYMLMRKACGLRASRASVPEFMLRAAGRAGDLSAKLRVPLPVSTHVIASLLDSACYSSGALQAELGWTPRIDIAAGLLELARLEHRAKC